MQNSTQLHQKQPLQKLHAGWDLAQWEPSAVCPNATGQSMAPCRVTGCRGLDPVTWQAGSGIQAIFGHPWAKGPDLDCDQLLELNQE